MTKTQTVSVELNFYFNLIFIKELNSCMVSIRYRWVDTWCHTGHGGDAFIHSVSN